MVTTLILLNILIAIAYFGLAVLAVLWTRLPIPRWICWMLRIFAATFFLGCGIHHLHYAIHISSARPAVVTELVDWHFLAVEMMQAFAAPATDITILIALHYMTVTIQIKDFVSGDVPPHLTHVHVDQRDEGDPAVDVNHEP
jgi:hypothetical protein